MTDISCMKCHPGSELCAPPLLDFDHWHCLHKIPSRKWVVCTSSAWFWSLTLPAWNPIQAVSCVRLLCSILITDIACMKSHPVCESCTPPLLDSDHWHCLHEIPSRKWVLCAPLLLDSDHRHCLHGIPSREWVVCAHSARFRSLTLPAWYPIQSVSHVRLLCSISITDIACMKFPSRQWVVCTSSARFKSLTLPAWNTIQPVSHVRLLCSILITDTACMKSHPGSESCAPPLLGLNHWHCLYEIPFRMWVCSMLIADLLSYYLSSS